MPTVRSNLILSKNIQTYQKNIKKSYLENGIPVYPNGMEIMWIEKFWETLLKNNIKMSVILQMKLKI